MLNNNNNFSLRFSIQPFHFPGTYIDIGIIFVLDIILMVKDDYYYKRWRKRERLRDVDCIVYCVFI